jgi:6-phosphofructokinase 1
MGVNALVGQSGGPTSAINATLSGIIKQASKSKNIDILYGMQNGIEGFLKEQIIDLTYLYGDNESLSALELTPASALGSCRYKLPSVKENMDFYKNLFSLFEKYSIRYFFYIGGNDSMDTVKKLTEYLKYTDYDLKVIGVPKTVDNDLPITHHTPGFGSAAKFIGTTIKEIAADCSVYTKKAVTIVELMGRDAGWLTASAGLPSYFGYKGADLIYLPERFFDDDAFIEAVLNQLEKKPYVVVAVSEGIRYPNGKYVGEGKQNGVTDEFGHKYLAGTAKVLEALVKEKIGCKVRSVELNLPQRCSAHILSKTDIQDSIKIGKRAVKYALLGKSGIMLIFKWKNGKTAISYVKINRVANKVRLVTDEFINQEANNVTSKCMEYIAPLIIGEPKLKYENGLPVHLNLR